MTSVATASDATTTFPFCPDTDIETLRSMHRAAIEPRKSKYEFALVPGLFSTDEDWWSGSEIGRKRLGRGTRSWDDVYTAVNGKSSRRLSCLRRSLPSGWRASLLHVQRHAAGEHTSIDDDVRKWSEGNATVSETDVNTLIKHRMHNLLTKPDPSLSEAGRKQCAQVNDLLRTEQKVDMKIPKLTFASTLCRTVETGKLTTKGLHGSDDLSMSPIILEPLREMLHSYPCDKRSSRKDMEASPTFGGAIFDESITEHDPWFRSVRDRQKLAEACCPQDARVESSEDDDINSWRPTKLTHAISKVLAAAGCTALEGIDRLAPHSWLVEGHTEVNSPLAYRMTQGLDKMLDTLQTVSDARSSDSTDAPQDMLIETHGISGKTLLTMLSEAKLSNESQSGLDALSETIDNQQLKDMLSHQRLDERPRPKMPDNAEYSIWPIIYRLKEGQSVDDTIGQAWLKQRTPQVVQ